MSDVRSALVENGVVTNIIVGKAKGFIECSPDVSVGWSYDGGEFTPATPVLDLGETKLRKIEELTSLCMAFIVSGYKSDALGAPHTYPNKLTDQINMMGSVSASLLPNIPDDWATPFWCADESGTWAFRMHSREEIQLAGSDGKAHVVLCQSTLERLTSQVSDAATVGAVESISWDIG